MSYVPAFAKAAINKLKNTFYSRMSEIVRIGGPQSYRDAISGKNGGVDLYGSSLNTFIGQNIIAELMVMKRVGVFVDRPEFSGNLLSLNRNNKPYLYYYCAEDILSWDFTNIEGEYIYTNVLLRDWDYEYDEEYGLAKGIYERYRHLWLAEDGVHMQIWQANMEDDAEDDIKVSDEIILKLNRLPFVIAGLNESLIADVCNYQIAMMNVASADINYVYRANFPFYTEQYDPAAESAYMRRPPRALPDETGNDPTQGTSNTAQQSGQNEIRVGSMHGRRYPKNIDRPDFIAPPTEPLEASMKKQQQMKDEIFELVDLAASRATPQHASAESKKIDNTGLESGLAYVGLELEYLENEIAKVWAAYENEKPAVIKYPEKYSLKSDTDRLNEAKALDEVKTVVPSRTFSKEVGKRIAHVMLKEKVTDETIYKIEKEIDAAEYISSDPELIKTASEIGMVDAMTGSTALGFNAEKVVPKAQEEHAKRLALIAASQSPRGVNDNAAIQGKDAANKLEKDQSQGGNDTDPNPAKDKVRG